MTILAVDEVRAMVGHNINEPWRWSEVVKVMQALEQKTREETKVRLAKAIIALLD